MDIPFAPANCNAGKLMPVRDNEGAVRIFEPGRVPLPDDVMAYHRQKIAERAKAEGRPVYVPDGGGRYLRNLQRQTGRKAAPEMNTVNNIHITRALFVPGYSSFYFDDQQAIKDGAAHEGFTYIGRPVTPGFQAVRQAGECVSVLLQLSNGQVAVGDCAAVQYSGAGGARPFVPGFAVRAFPRTARRCVAGRPRGQGIPGQRPLL